MASSSTNVLDNTTSPYTKCYDVSNLFGESVGQNFSYDEAKAFKCSTAMIWAKTHGIKNFPQYYTNYTDDGLSENSSWADFQCALYTMRGTDEAGTGWNCTYPCTSTLPQCPPPAADTDLPTVTNDAGSNGSGSGSMQWWAWLLIALALLGLIGAVGYFMMGRKEAPKKKKRAVKKADPAPAPAPAATPTPATITAPPVYVTQARAAPMVQVPVATTAAPVTYAAPAAVTAQPVAMAMPIQTVAAPTASVFDRLDTHHDGVISRAEFAQYGVAPP